jgi:hypothetical protein
MVEMARVGACRCAQVRFRITKAPVMTMACHCRGCQKMTASAFSLSALVPADGFELTHGEPDIGGLHGASRHYFCPHCKSWLFTRPEGVEGFVNVRTPMLEDSSGLEPFIETMTAEKMSWAATPATTSFAGFPSPTDFGRLMQSYSEQRR